jgi:hypothetical protein
MSKKETAVGNGNRNVVIIRVICIIIFATLVGLSVWRTPQRVPAPRAVKAPDQPDMSLNELKALADHLEKYYNAEHKADTTDCRWRAIQIRYDIRPKDASKDSRVGLIEYVAQPEFPREMVEPTGHRLVLVYENNRWVLMKARMHLSNLQLAGGENWRDIPYDNNDLARVAEERLGIPRVSF